MRHVVHVTHDSSPGHGHGVVMLTRSAIARATSLQIGHDSRQGDAEMGTAGDLKSTNKQQQQAAATSGSNKRGGSPKPEYAARVSYQRWEKSFGFTR